MFTELYLGRWDRSRNIENLFKYTQKDYLLSELAHFLQVAKRDCLADEELKRIIHAVFEKRRQHVDVDAMIKELCERSPMLLVDDRQLYRFKHLSFQEYFAAKWLSTRGVNDEFLIGHFLDSWWAPVIFFIFGIKKDGGSLFEKLIDKVPSESLQNKLSKARALGMSAQAAYMTEHNMKVDVVRCGVQLVVDSYFELLAYLRNNQNELNNVPRFILILIFREIFEESFKSTYMLEACKEVFVEEHGKPVPEEMFDAKHLFLTSYFLANSLRGLDHPEYILMLEGKVPTYDKTLQFLLGFDYKGLSKSNALLASQQELYRKAWSKIEKRVRKASKELLREMDRPAFESEIVSEKKGERMLLNVDDHLLLP